MKKIFIAIILSSLTLQAYAFQKPTHFKPAARVGIGYSQTDIDPNLLGDSHGSGIRIEAGYDFNANFGLQASLEYNEDNIQGLSIEGTTWKIGADFGQQFVMKNKMLFKPYGIIGLAQYEENFCYSHQCNTGTFEGSGYFLGLGVRITMPQGFYTSIEYNYLPDISDSDFKADMTQTFINAGLKF